jgi:hypothetical protein
VFRKLLGMKPSKPPVDVALEVVRTRPFPADLLQRALAPFSGTVHVDHNLLGWVDQGLRQHYAAAVLRRPVGMPSKLVDAAWHAHITYTLDYQQFCEAAYGRFLHHTPESVMSGAAVAENQTVGLWNSWQGACQVAGLHPDGTEVPALFAVDGVASLPGAVRWIGTCGQPRCLAPPGVHCIRHHVADPAATASESACGGCGGAVACGSSCGGSSCGGGCGGD